MAIFLDNGTPCCDPDIMIGAYSVNLAQKIKKQSTGKIDEVHSKPEEQVSIILIAIL